MRRWTCSRATGRRSRASSTSVRRGRMRTPAARRAIACACCASTTRRPMRTIPNKPNMVVLAAIHAREYTTAELVTRFAEWLVNGYGTDPEATWLLDNFRFHFLLQANPDGRKKAESGMSWRKNTDTDNGMCSANAYGVDLNRNFTWRFGTGGRRLERQCRATRRIAGPASPSEEEVAERCCATSSARRAAAARYAAACCPTGAPIPAPRRPTTAGCSSTSTASRSWCCGRGPTPPPRAPNAAALRTLGRRLAYFNSYRPVQWIGPVRGRRHQHRYGVRHHRRAELHDRAGAGVLRGLRDVRVDDVPAQLRRAQVRRAQPAGAVLRRRAGPTRRPWAPLRFRSCAARLRRVGVDRRRALQPEQRFRSRCRPSPARMRISTPRPGPSGAVPLPCARATARSVAAASRWW